MKKIALAIAILAIASVASAADVTVEIVIPDAYRPLLIDTVKAKLAPNEAVLNREAADMLGRGLIQALNSVGAQKMGMV
jgi:hypothetical protein